MTLHFHPLRVVLVSAFALLLAAAPAAAQGFGIKAGYLYNSLDFDDGEDVFDGEAGWVAGLFFGGNRSGTIGLQG